MNIPFIREFALSPAGSRKGISCGPDGLFAGEIPLLKRVRNAHGQDAWEPRDEEDLSKALSASYGLPVDARRKAAGLGTVARALNGGDVALAQIAALHLQLPDLPSSTEVLPLSDDTEKLATLLQESGLLKGEWDPEKHPRYPAGAPDRRGGQFAPKAGSPGMGHNPPEPMEDPARPNPAQEVIDRAVKLAGRRAFRAAATSALKLGGDLLLDAIPVVDVAVGVSTVYDIYQALHEYDQFRVSVDAVRAFAAHGPQTLEELRMSGNSISFDSFSDFKKLGMRADMASFESLSDFIKRFGAAGDGYIYHHIVEQSSRFPASVIQNTDNIVRIPLLLHEEVNSCYMQTCPECQGRSVREWLRTQSLETNREKGLQILRDVGILKE